MNQDVEVYVEGSSVYLRAPWSLQLTEFIDGTGAKWDRERGIFQFDAALAPHIVALAESLFFTSGTSPLATVNVDASCYSDVSSIVLAGRSLVSRVSPSRRPVLAKNVVILSGSWTWPAENFRIPTIGANDVTLQTVLPLAFAQQSHPGLTIVPTLNTKDGLIAERDRLMGRLEDIEIELDAA